MVLDAMSFLNYAVADRNRILCVPRAYLWLLSNFRKVYSARLGVQAQRTISDKKVMGIMVDRSVALQHYLLGRKLFTQIDGCRTRPVF